MAEDTAGVKDPAIFSEFANSLERDKIGKVLLKKSLTRFTTVQIGGPAPVLVEIQSVDEAALILKRANEFALEYRFLGGGSNVLIPDNGIESIVIKAGRGLRCFSRDGLIIEAGAAMPLMPLSRECSGAGLSGLEFAAGIPAHTGGAVRMNSGAHGGEISSVLKEVLIALPDGKTEWLAATSLKFDYRRCNLPYGSMVLSARFELKASEPASCAALLNKNLSYRKATQPLTTPSFGSVFKNPLPEYAGKLIEDCGLKGHREGDAEISALHANWIINPGRSASCNAVLSLMKQCQEAVQKRYGIMLEAEVDYWGAPGSYLF